MDEIRNKILDIISQGNLEGAFKLLKDKLRVESNWHTEITTLESRFSRNERKKLSGIESNQNLNIEETNISHSIIKITKSLTTEDLKQDIIKKADIVQLPYFTTYELPGTKITISDVYIEPYFDVFYKNVKDVFASDKKYINAFPEINLHAFIREILNDNHLAFQSKITCPEARLIILEGYPGQGKTSFCYRLEHDLQNNSEKRTIFFPLHKISDTEEFIKKPFRHIKEFKRDDSINFASTILILDGLSEIKGFSKEYINRLIDNLLSNLEEHYPDTYVIITSRYHIVDSGEFDEDRVLLLALSQFDEFQQKDWITKFNDKNPSSFLNEQILFEIKESNPLIIDIIGVPAILYFLSTKEQKNNDSFLYTSLFQYIFSRNWVEKSKIHSIKDIKPEHFFSFYEYLAAILQRATTGSASFSSLSGELSENQSIAPELDGNSTLLKIIDKCFKKGYDYKLALRNFLSSFFIEEKLAVENAPDDFHFKYLGKHIQAYLLAKYIYEKELIKNFPTIDTGYQGDQSKTNQALNTIWRSFVHPPLPQETIRFLCELVEKREGSKENAELIEKIKAALPSIIENQLLYKYEVPGYSSPPIDKCLDGFHAFWQILTRLAPEENWIEPASLEKLVNLIRLDIIIHNRTFDLSYQNFSYANFNGIVFEKEIFDYAILEYANFEHAKFYVSSTSIEKSSMNNVKAKQAKFNKAVLHEIEMKDGDFTSAEFEETDLSSSITSGSNFTTAKMEKANMSAGDFTGSNFSGAKMQNVNLTAAAKLIGANMEAADLTKANISGADLTGATLDYANLQEAIMSGVVVDPSTSFKSADLRGANLYGIQGVSWEILAEKLADAFTLFQTEESLPPKVIEIIKRTHPDLFDDPDQILPLDDDEQEESPDALDETSDMSMEIPKQ